MNQKVDPKPGSLSTSQVPPICSARSRAMASPRPLPPKRRSMEPCNCTKGVKILARSSGEIPIPVSRTATRTRASSAEPPSSVTRTATRPWSVKRTALSTSTCSTFSKRILDPITTSGTPGSMPIESSRPFAMATRHGGSSVRCTDLCRRNGARSIPARPASSCE